MNGKLHDLIDNPNRKNKTRLILCTTWHTAQSQTSISKQNALKLLRHSVNTVS